MRQQSLENMRQQRLESQRKREQEFAQQKANASTWSPSAGTNVSIDDGRLPESKERQAERFYRTGCERERLGQIPQAEMYFWMATQILPNTELQKKAQDALDRVRALK